jgi:hypothetical protein
VLCALAAMSNNRGGFLFLGVANADCEAVGVGDAFDSFDIAKLMDKVKVHLAPTPRITCKGVIDLNGTKVGFIHVDPHPDKPVIVSKDDGDKLREGEILFRYAGQSARIKFTDLREMLAERDRRAQLALAHAAGKLADVGTSNALILDTDKNVLDADGRKIFIDEELAKSINFIKEGQFNEIDGAPTLKLVGEVTPVNAQALTTEKLVPKAIAQNDILLAFLEQEAVTNPKEYVLAGVSQPRTWLPIFYFANLASVQPAEMADEVKNVGTSQKAKRQSVLDRFAGTKTAYAKPPTKKAAAAIAAIIDGTFVVPKTIGEASIFSQAMTSIAKTTASLDKILSALKASYALAVSADDGAVLSFVFKAACRADEIFFQPQ